MVCLLICNVAGEKMSTIFVVYCCNCLMDRRGTLLGSYR